MKMKTVYLTLCVLGLALPYWQFVPWVAENGLNLRLMVQQLFANRISAFFGMDVIVSSVVLLVFSGRESARLGVRGRWMSVIALLTVGVSLAFPLFLYLRERKMEEAGTTA
jgi:hypothetical protein